VARSQVNYFLCFFLAPRRSEHETGAHVSTAACTGRGPRVQLAVRVLRGAALHQDACSWQLLGTTALLAVANNGDRYSVHHMGRIYILRPTWYHQSQTIFLHAAAGKNLHDYPGTPGRHETQSPR